MRPIADLSRTEIAALKRVGFWWSDERPHLPHPRDFVDPVWQASEGPRVLGYLEEAYCVPYFAAGYAWCRLGCPDWTDGLGSEDRTDGTYLFPEGLSHYVRVHAVRPPTEFLEHLRANNYRVPRLPAISL